MYKIAIVAAFIVGAHASVSFAQLNDVFTYQGEIEKDGAPFDGTCDFRFSVFDALSGGTQIGFTQNRTATVDDGLFSVLIDANNAFNGAVRFLEIGTRCPSGTGTYVDLSPRQQLTAAPYAFYAPNAGLAGALGCLGCVDTSRLASEAVTDQKVASGISYGKLSGAPSSLPPSGPAGGSLTGTYPNPTLTGGSIATFNLLDSIVTSNKIAQAGVSTGNLASSAVTSEKLAFGAVQPSHLSFTPGTVQSVTTGTGLSGGIITENGTISVDFGSTAQTVAAGDHQHGGDFWKLDGNSGTTPGTHFVGTTDVQTLELRVGGVRSLSMEPTGSTINLIAGASANSRTSGISGATVGGGGSTASPNQVHSDYATVSGGRGNQAWADATVGGGRNNQAQFLAATVGGGSTNVAMDMYSTVSGGVDNTAIAESATVGGGNDNTALGRFSVVGGGGNNDANGEYSIVAGGQDNRALATYATISGGGRSDAQNADSANRVTDDYGTVGGGADNTAGNDSGTIQDAVGATVCGGGSNTAGGPHSTVGGGFLSAALGLQSTVGGGTLNLASGSWSTVPGGILNSAEADGSYAAGSNAHATHIGSFVWSDGSTAAASVGPNTFNAVASGGFRFVFNANGDQCNLTSASGWICSGPSDRDLKENITDVDSGDILARLARIPISTWNYRNDGSKVRHIGPMAQDFHHEFQVGADDRHIGTVDGDGVALAAIKGLYLLVQQQRREIDDLREYGATLELRLSSLEDRSAAFDRADPHACSGSQRAALATTSATGPSAR